MSIEQQLPHMSSSRGYETRHNKRLYQCSGMLAMSSFVCAEKHLQDEPKS
jgi:hypothetical protein